ncbi:hypothetical protein [Actinomyces vulturis]|uniref:hypothetical protein n=1 Tax=Actinomyces vulturis TaxID=1857645 RepID=UPI000B1A7DD0
MPDQPRRYESFSQGQSRGSSSDRGSGRASFRDHHSQDERRSFRNERHDNGRRSFRRDGEERRSFRRDGDGERHSVRGDRHDERRGGRPGSSRGAQFRDRQDSRASRRRDNDSRPPQSVRVPEPPLADDIAAGDLDPSARKPLRALGRQNADNVARHLVMVQRLLETDPALALAHARYANSHAGRVAVVREATAMAAYLAGEYSEALREIRTARRLSGLDIHRAIEADCERALGRYDAALRVAEEVDPRFLDDAERAELAIVISGVRHEMGHDDLALLVIEDAIRQRPADRETLRRLHLVRADRLEEQGQKAAADAIRERVGINEPTIEDEEVTVFDLEEEFNTDDDFSADDNESFPDDSPRSPLNGESVYGESVECDNADTDSNGGNLSTFADDSAHNVDIDGQAEFQSATNTEDDDQV